MTPAIPLERFVVAVVAMRGVFERHLDLLTDLDSVVGDGDHGLSMARGFRSVAEKVGEIVPGDVGQVCAVAGSTLVGSIGGVTGPIFGTMFVRWGAASEGKQELGTGDLARMGRAGLEGVQELGQARVGDKTVVDALAPAVAALEDAADRGLPPADALVLAAEAARRGAEGTKALRATKGRARYQGEKSIGHQDAGATSVALIFEALRDALRPAARARR